MAREQPSAKLRAWARENLPPVCHLCVQFIDMDAPHNTPEQPVLDRIIPGSWGGTYTEDNVIYAHRGCNASRGNDLMRVQPDGSFTTDRLAVSGVMLRCPTHGNACGGTHSRDW